MKLNDYENNMNKIREWAMTFNAGVTCQNRKCNDISCAVFSCLCFEFSRCRNKVEKNYLQKCNPLTFLFVAMYFPQMNYGYIARTMPVFEGYAKRIFADPVSCVNAKRPRLA